MKTKFKIAPTHRIPCKKFLPRCREYTNNRDWAGPAKIKIKESICAMAKNVKKIVSRFNELI